MRIAVQCTCTDVVLVQVQYDVMCDQVPRSDALLALTVSGEPKTFLVETIDYADIQATLILYVQEVVTYI